MADPVNAGQLADRIEIVDVVNRYATALDARDWDLLDRVFSSDVSGASTTTGSGACPSAGESSSAPCR